MTRGTLVGLLAIASACTRSTSSSPARDGAKFSFEVRDGTGQLIPARITLVAVAGTQDVKLSTSDAGDRFGRLLVSGNKIMTLDGTGTVEVPPGSYDIYVSRGIEWTLAVVPRVLLGTAGYTLHAQLDHVVDTTGWLSGDFHVHAAPSWDSYVPLANRAMEFVTEGVDLIVSTDHNMVADYAPAIRELAAAAYLDSMIGDEITTLREGHFGVYPLPAALVGEPYGSVWRHRGEAANIFPVIRRDHPDSLIQVNHPRSRDWMGYFKDESYDRGTGRGKRPGFSLAFDTVEVLNGRAMGPTEQVLGDWFSLLDHGHIVTAMGNSDTHELGTGIGGYPRNYLRVRDDRPSKASAEDIIGALRGHHAFFTTGPFVSLRSGTAGIGDVVTARDGRVTLAIEVTAAPWIGVDSATLYMDGRVEKQWPIAPSRLPQRLEVEHTITVAHDSYVVLRADGHQRMWPIAGDAEHARVVPLAITNPLFIDRDGDGAYTR